MAFTHKEISYCCLEMANVAFTLESLSLSRSTTKKTQQASECDAMISSIHLGSVQVLFVQQRQANCKSTGKNHLHDLCTNSAWSMKPFPNFSEPTLQFQHRNNEKMYQNESDGQRVFFGPPRKKRRTSFHFLVILAVL